MRTAHRSPHTRRQLSHVERLGDVIVGARVKRFNLIVLAVPYGEHQDRQTRRQPVDFAAGLYTAHARHIHVEEHRVVVRLADKTERLLPGSSLGDAESEVIESYAQRAPNGGFVIHHEYIRRSFRHVYLPCTGAE